MQHNIRLVTADFCAEQSMQLFLRLSLYHCKNSHFLVDGTAHLITVTSREIHTARI
jgi:hypothetical protein